MLDRYVAQVRLLLSVLPDIATETVFALKGGTAINLFYRDMPRLSVDVDLTCLPVADRQSSLEDMDDAFNRIATAVTERNPRVKARRILVRGLRLPRGFSAAGLRPVLSGSVPPPILGGRSQSIDELQEDMDIFTTDQDGFSPPLSGVFVPCRALLLSFPAMPD